MKKFTPSVFFCCYFAYLFIYVARLNLSISAPALRELEVLSTAQIGFLGSAFSVVYACGRLFSGTLADRVIPWKLLFIGLAICGIANILIGILPPFALFLVLWSMNAFAQSLLWGPILRILTQIYPASIAKTRASYMSTAVAAGNLVAIVLNTKLVENAGAQWAFLFPGGIVLVMSFLVIALTHHVKPPVSAPANGGIRTILRNRELQKMLPSAIIHGVMKDNVSLWMTVYVMDTFGVDLEKSSCFVLLIPLLGLVGRLLTPGLHQVCKEQEKPLMIASFLVCILCTGGLVLYPCSVAVSVVYLSLIYMAVSIINACLLSFFPIRFAEAGHTASVSGIMDFATYLGTGLSAMVYGFLIHRYGYNAMYLSWGLISVVAVGLLMKLSPKKILTK